MKIAVSGANGFVGSYICDLFEAQGEDVLRLQRQPGQAATPFVLGEELDPSCLEGVDVLVHTAYDFNPLDWDEVDRVNVQGSIRLIQSAEKAGVKKVIFISSISAFEGCKSEYGRGKAKVEEVVNQMGGVSLRPGLIYGDSRFGMYSKLKKISILPILPVFD